MIQDNSKDWKKLAFEIIPTKTIENNDLYICEQIGYVPHQQYSQQKSFGEIPISPYSKITNVQQTEMFKLGQSSGITVILNSAYSSLTIVQLMERLNQQRNIIEILMTYQIYFKQEFESTNKLQSQQPIKTLMQNIENSMVYCFMVDSDSRRLISISYSSSLIEVIGLTSECFLNAVIITNEIPDPCIHENIIQQWSNKIQHQVRGEPYQEQVEIMTYEGHQYPATAHYDYYVQGTPQVYLFYERIKFCGVEKQNARQKNKRLTENSSHLKNLALDPEIQLSIKNYQELMRKYEMEEIEKDDDKQPEQIICTYRELDK